MDDWRDATFEEQLRSGAMSRGFAQWLGFDLVGAGQGRCILSVELRHDMTQRMGYCHGGIVGALADSAVAIAAATLGGQVLTQSYTIQFLKPAIGPLIRAEGQVIRAGRRITSSEGRIYSVTEGEEPMLCAVALASIATV